MDYRSLLNGERKDASAFVQRVALRIATLPYRIVVWQRNRGFDRGRFEVHRANVPVVSVGNITTGGTGKTPLVCYVARHFRRQAIRVSIVSRGYGAKPGEDNDEAMELADQLPDVPHVQDADRVEAARIACDELETQVIVMDDGFQHRRLHRDLNIVVIDATNPFGFGYFLPRGLLREPLSSLARGDIVVLSRSDMIDAEAKQRIREVVRRHAPDVGWAEAIHAPRSLMVWQEGERPIETIAGKRVAALCAIGNPEGFLQTLRGCGVDVVDSMTLGDHDAYDRQTIVQIEAWLRRLDDVSIEVVCTHKDLVKLQTGRLAGHRLCALLIEMRFVAGENDFRDSLDRIVQSSS